MRIAFVVNSSWNIYNFRLGLIRILQAKGYEVVAIAPEDDFTDALKKEVPFIPVRISSKGVNPFSDLRLTTELRTIYRAVKPDCILHYTIKPNIYGALAAGSLKIPSISTVSGLGTVFLHKGLVSTMAQQLYRLAFRMPSTIVFQNKDDEDLFVSRHLVHKRKTALVPGSGINLDRYREVGFSRHFPFRFLLISRLLLDKGILEFADAAATIRKKFPDTEFWLAGAHEENKRLGIPQSLVKSWEERSLIKYFGFVNDVRPLIESADVIVLPSYREGTPRALLEAAAMGKPIIATDVPGCREIAIKDFNAFVCDPRSSSALALQMEKALTSPDSILISLAKNGRKLAEDKFNEQKVADLYISFIQKAIVPE